MNRTAPFVLITLMGLTGLTGPAMANDLRDISTCWNVGMLSDAAKRVKVTLVFDLARDGTPVADSITLLGDSGTTPPARQQAFQAARRAILRCGAGGFDLPQQTYEQWRRVEMTFDPADMRSK